jgi:peptide/nickel transport system permease protein
MRPAPSPDAPPPAPSSAAAPAGPAGPGSAPVPRRTRVPAPLRALVRGLLRDPRGAVGLAILVLFTFVSVFAPWLAPQNPNAASSFSSSILGAPSTAHWLGTDEDGRDVLSELILGTQTTMLVGFVAAVVSTVIGTAVGVIGGYVGGWTDRLLTLLDDWFLVLPVIPVTILAATLLGPKADSLPLGQTSVLILVIGLFGWAGTSRIVRAHVLTLKERAFVERSRTLGASHWRIMRRQILPNVIPLVSANAVIYVSLAILTESTLSFLGLGDPNRFSWGRMLDSAYTSGAAASGAWAYFLPPGICIALAVLGFSLLGHAIEHLVDPRLRERR